MGANTLQRGIVLGLLAGLVGTVPVRAAQPAQKVAIDVQHGDATIALRPLDDPANPYRNAYTAVDRYIYENAWTLSGMQDYRARSAQREPRSNSWAVEPGNSVNYEWAAIAAAATPEGWMKPVEYLYALPTDSGLLDGWPLRQRLTERYKAFVAGAHETATVWAGAPVPPEVYAEYQWLQLRRLAAVTPRIPDWLGQHPPRIALFIPNGEIVTYGPLQDLPPLDASELLVHNASNSGWGAGLDRPGLSWHRYSPDGTLLEELPSNQYEFDQDGWAALYWPDKPQAAGDGGELRRGEYNQLYWVRYVSGTDEAGAPGLQPAAAWSYDGTPLDLDQPLPVELAAMPQLGASGIQQVYAAQQRFGVAFGAPGRGFSGSMAFGD